MEEEANAFDRNADLTVEFEHKNSLYYLEAFQSTFNDRILKESKDFQRLRWFSFGAPMAHLCFTSGSPLSRLCLTSVSPLLHLYFTFGAPLVHMWVTSSYSV